MTLRKYLEENNKIGERSEFILNKKINIPVYMVDIYDLRFNPYNTRIKTHQLTYGLDKTSLEDKEAQKRIQDLINKDRSIDSKVPSSIRKAGVLREIIALSNGLILSGNNRVAILREMIENGEDIPREIKVAILDKELEKKDIISLEQSLQKEYDAKDEYKKMNVVLQVRDSINEQGSDIDEISENLGLDKAKIREYDKIANYYDEFLCHCEIVDKYNYHDKYDVYSKLKEILRIENNSKLSYKLKNELKKLVFNLMISTNASTWELTKAISKAIKIKQEHNDQSYAEELHSLINNDDELREKTEFVKEEVKKSINNNTELIPEAISIRNHNGEKVNNKINNLIGEMNEFLDESKMLPSPSKLKKDIMKAERSIRKFFDIYSNDPNKYPDFAEWINEIRKIIN